MENIISVDLSTSTAPVVTETRGKEWISYGTDDWANLYPQFLIDLYYNSSTQAAIINATAEMIAGEDLVIDDEDERELDAIVKLKKFFAEANSNETLHEVIKKISFDFKLQGAFALNIVWSQDRTQIAEIYHIGVEKIRAEKPNELGKVEAYYVSSDWANTRTHKPYRVPAFNTKDRTSANQILYSGLYSPSMNVYHTPDYLAANNWALVDQRVAEFHLNNISNGFSGSFMVSFANGVPTQEERFQIEQSLTDKFASEKNAGKFILTFSDDKTRTPEITAITPSDLDKQYLALQELLVQNILSGHRVTSKTLMGIDSTNGFSSNTDELVNAANFYLNTVVAPFQEHIIKVLRKIFTVNNMDMPVSFVQLKPITVQFDSATIRDVMTQDEIREELGLPPLNDQEVVRDEYSKVGMIDGKPVFSTIEEAEEHSKTLGCKGYHEHEYEGKTVYMACESHDELMNFNKTELEAFLETLEDIPDDWELIEEEVVDGEHQDFDFEKTLNEFANDKIELTSTGTARPNARSEQDGVNRSYNDYYKVRYVYENDDFLVNKSGTKREFCRKMESANKIYRKEDILKMGKMAVNPGFGIEGAATYSIWLYKGGPQCFHYWSRRIYKTSLRNAKSKISSSQLIGYTKARSEGFTAEKNDNLVAIPPRKMKNNGYYN
mgnify:CR=1 FL=1|tara:strand:+ start:1110 stop:3104 length:1995 start_codon:yes stop_codon:yes gene_type:complete